MFDFPIFNVPDDILRPARHLFDDAGYDLSRAAALLGGATAERRVISCALRLQTAKRLDYRLRGDLVAIHRLLSLHEVGEPESEASGFFACLRPGSAEVETICLLADRLDDVLRDLGITPDCWAGEEDFEILA